MNVQQMLIDELQSLERQRENALATLHQVEGAIRLTRHLLAKTATQGAQAETTAQAGVNGSEN